MKKLQIIFVLILLLIGTDIILAQSVPNEPGNFRFGLKISPSINWMKPTGKIISRDGVSPKFGGGLVVEYVLAKVISFQTGIQIDISGGKVNYNNGEKLTSPSSNSVSYYYNNLDATIAKFDSTLSPALYNHNQLNNRSYNITYITIPLSFKMKTKEIGLLTYYGQFGINNSFRWKATAKDQVQQITATGLGNSQALSKTDVTNDVCFYTASLNMGLGTEINLSGSSSLTLGLNYLLGFTNVVKDGSQYLRRRINDANSVSSSQAMPQQIMSNAVVLSIGMLF